MVVVIRWNCTADSCTTQNHSKMLPSSSLHLLLLLLQSRPMQWLTLRWAPRRCYYVQPQLLMNTQVAAIVLCLPHLALLLH
jgi:hypothetical protein